jgi:hypothetical protein
MSDLWRQFETCGLWNKPKPLKHSVRIVVERPRGRFHTIDPLCLRCRDGVEQKRPADASSSPIRMHRQLINLAPTPRLNERIFRNLIHEGQQVTDRQSVLLGDPKARRRFFKK